MATERYLICFLASLSISLSLTPAVRNLAARHGWLHSPSTDRHMHSQPVPRLGGVAVFASFTFVIAVFLLTAKLTSHFASLPVKEIISGLFWPALLVFLLGLYDDLRGVSPYGKIAVQAAAAILLYIGGFGIQYFDLMWTGQILRTAVGLPLTILWVLLITNAFNLIDGLDGLAAGSALFSTLVVFVMSLIVPNPGVTFLTIALAGATLGFLRFNFHPASIFLGDSGSLFIGFMLSALALASSQKAPTMVAVAIPLISLGLPILDVVLAVARRFLSGKPLFKGDARHIHHQLLKRGFSQRDAVLVLYAVSAGFAFLSLVLLQERRAIALVLAVVGIGIFVGLQQLRYQELAELLSVMQRVTRRRHIIANHVAVRQATESLKECNEFRSICQVVQDTFRDMGFDGIRLQMLDPNGFSSSAFHPLHAGPDGSFLLPWSHGEASEPPWELRLELVTSSLEKWGYLTLYRLSAGEALTIDLNILTSEFRTSLSDALSRACERLELSDHVGKVNESKVRKFAAGSMAD